MRRISCLLALAILAFSIYADDGEDRLTASSIETWRNILQTPELTDYFLGVFNHLGIEVEETGERFTIHHQGRRFAFEEGINEGSVDFIVPVKIRNINNMVAHAEDGVVSPDESWRILDVLFTPLTRVTLQTPVLSINWRRKLAGVEDLTHVYLINPSGGEASKHTLIYVKGQWLVLRGIHGKPRRTYRMSPEQALEYQRKIFSAMQKNTLWAWWKFSRFYRKWRKVNSVTHKF